MKRKFYIFLTLFMMQTGVEMEYRDRQKICLDILLFISKHGASTKSRIMRGVNLNWSMANQYLDLLFKVGLLNKHKKRIMMITKRKKNFYELTSESKTYIDLQNEINKIFGQLNRTFK